MAQFLKRVTGNPHEAVVEVEASPVNVEKTFYSHNAMFAEEKDSLAGFRNSAMALSISAKKAGSSYKLEPAV